MKLRRQIQTLVLVIALFGAFNLSMYQLLTRRLSNNFSGATQAQMIMYSKLFKINFTKMDPYEFKTFTDILQRYSDLCKPVRGNGRGRKKK